MTLILKRILGLALVILGLIALVTPLTPGSWLALLGFELLGLSFLFPRRVREPWEKMKIEWKEWIQKWYRKNIARRSDNH